MTESSITFAWAARDVVIIRIKGRGTFENSPYFQDLVQKLRNQNPNVKIIVDLSDCISMDSTFMGTLAGISTEQNKAGEGYLTVVNTREHTRHLLQNLGLSYILDMRDHQDVEVNEDQFQEIVTNNSLSKFEKIIHMIEAHTRLVNLDDKNEMRFQSVIKYLQDSLEREKQKQKQETDQKD